MPSTTDISSVTPAPKPFALASKVLPVSMTAVLFVAGVAIGSAFATWKAGHSQSESLGTARVYSDVVTASLGTAMDDVDGLFPAPDVPDSPVDTPPPSPASAMPGNPIKALAGRWTPDVLAAARDTGVPAIVIAAVLRTESSGRPWITSQAGAKGLMQVLPGTARHVGIHNWWVPSRNILAGARYLKKLLRRYEGNLPLVLAAYNAGPTAVDRYSGVPPYHETRDYVRKVEALVFGLGDS